MGSSEPVELLTAHDGLRVLSGPLRLEPPGGRPCSPGWRREGTTLSAPDGTRLSIGRKGRVCKGPFCLRCLNRASRNSLRFGWCPLDFEPVDALPVGHGQLREAVCEHTPTVWRAAAQGELLKGAIALVFVLLCWLSGLRQQRRLAKALGRLALVRADSSRLRLAWRSSRDTTRPLSLVARLREGTHVAELQVCDIGGNSSTAWEDGWLRLAEDHSSIILTPPSTSSLMIRHRINLTELRQLRFGERIGEAETAARETAVLATSLPWRCLHLSTRGRDYVVRFSDDGPGLLWLEGLQALLHDSGHLKEPIRPATLLWLRARMRLGYAAARQGVSRQRLLANAISGIGVAERESLTTRAIK